MISGHLNYFAQNSSIPTNSLSPPLIRGFDSSVNKINLTHYIRNIKSHGGKSAEFQNLSVALSQENPLHKNPSLTNKL
jgi:hypothetical protein